VATLICEKCGKEKQKSAIDTELKIFLHPLNGNYCVDFKTKSGFNKTGEGSAGPS